MARFWHKESMKAGNIFWEPLWPFVSCSSFWNFQNLTAELVWPLVLAFCKQIFPALILVAANQSQQIFIGYWLISPANIFCFESSSRHWRRQRRNWRDKRESPENEHLGSGLTEQKFTSRRTFFRVFIWIESWGLVFSSSYKAISINSYHLSLYGWLPKSPTLLKIMVIIDHCTFQASFPIVGKFSTISPSSFITTPW